LEQFMAREYGLGYRADREFVHETRVATRRIRALLHAFKGAFDTDVKKIKDPLQRLADVLGEARDSDVFIVSLGKYEARVDPSHRAFVRSMIRRERARCMRRYEKLVAVTSSPQHRRFVDDFYRRLCRPVGKPGGLRPTPRKGTRALSRIGPGALFKRLESVWRFEGSLKKYDEEELHRLRILCKRLRYLAEFLADVYPDRLERIIRPATKLQDLLGDVHDVDVYAERIRRYREARRKREPDKAQDTACDALCAYLAEQRERRVKQANAVWKEFTAPKSRKRILKGIRNVVSGE
jgi:CHAD domain-containing protein